MKVHVVGAGAREHALRVVLGRTATVIDNADDADLVVIGPEVPLVAGLADELRAKGKLVYGPGRDGAQLEGSKAFMKDFLVRAGVATARHGSFRDAEAAVSFMRQLPPPYVVKTDGLAAGKGVLVTDDIDVAIADVQDKLSGASFGDAGSTVVIEEGMTGPEYSFFYVYDGSKKGVAFPIAQDFKRAYDDDQGPNTGGMGAYSGVPLVTADLVDKVMERIIEPTCWRLRKEEIDYRGTLYAGLMVTSEGPKLIEYNVRFGDPESQVVLPRFDGDLAATLASAAAGDLHVEGRVEGDQQAVTVVLASRDYPIASRGGDVITGLEEAEQLPGVMVFHAGTTLDDQGRFVTTGGRVLSVTALAPTLREARQRAYEAVKCVHFDGMEYRTDIALKASAA